jgi:hypothetical protein
MANAIDDFGGLQPGASSDISHLAVVTPDDANDLPHVTRSIYLGAVGAVKVTMLGGETVVIPSGLLSANAGHRIRISRIWATGTTATPIWVGW